MPGAPGLAFETWDSMNSRYKIGGKPKSQSIPEAVYSTFSVRSHFSQRLAHRPDPH
jgi:hypothetical protein